jgi:hypothetical protein
VGLTGALVALLAVRFAAVVPASSPAVSAPHQQTLDPSETKTTTRRATVPQVVPAAAPATTAASTFFAAWGGGRDQLGRERPEEGNPMGPMSLALDGQGRTWVLDEINRRVVRRGADGSVETAIQLDQRLPEDIAVARDGSIAVLDRLGDKDVTLYDDDGTLRGKLSLAGDGIGDTGEVSGVFVDGTDVYVERRHTELVLLGDTSGNPAQPRSSLAGRPTRDGTALLGAAIVDATAGRVRVTSTERDSGKLRFDRELQLWPTVHAILLLDADRAGTIYFATEVQRAGQSPTVVLSCLDPQSGVVVGGAMLPANTLPEESLRDLAVLDQGGVVYAHRSEAGVTYQQYQCQ